MAGHRRSRVERAQHPSRGIDLELFDAGLSAQVVLEAQLDAGLADGVTRLVAPSQPLARGQLVGVDLAGVPEDVGRQLTLRVLALGQTGVRDARELRRVLAHVNQLLLGDVAGDRHRLVDAVALALDAALELVARDAQDEGEARLHVRAHGQVVAVDRDDVGDAVADQLDPVAVEDAPARRLGRDQPHAVRRHGLVLVRRHHLQVPEAHEQGGEERQHDDTEHTQAQARRIGAHGLAHQA